MASVAKALTASSMPPAAVRAALEAFARVTHERHPDVVLVSLGRVGADGAVVSAAAGQVIRPFAALEARDTLLDRHTRVAASDDHRVH